MGRQVTYPSLISQSHLNPNAVFIVSAPEPSSIVMSGTGSEDLSQRSTCERGIDDVFATTRSTIASRHKQQIPPLRCAPVGMTGLC